MLDSALRLLIPYTSIYLLGRNKLARKRNQHRNKSTRFDCVAPNKMRTSSIVNVHVKHKSSYGRHMFNAELHNAHVQNSQAEINSGCVYEYIHDAEPKPITTWQRLPKPTPKPIGNIQPSYIPKSHQSNNKSIPNDPRLFMYALVRQAREYTRLRTKQELPQWIPIKTISTKIIKT